jgi:hypothetical protein
MSNALEIGIKLVALTREGKNLDAVRELYADDVVSVEAISGPGFDRIASGKQAVLAKNVAWLESHEIHEAGVRGPFPHGEDRFAVIFTFDATSKPDGRRSKLEEVGLFHVAGGKVKREEFFYRMGD